MKERIEQELDLLERAFGIAKPVIEVLGVDAKFEGLNALQTLAFGFAMLARRLMNDEAASVICGWCARAASPNANDEVTTMSVDEAVEHEKVCPNKKRVNARAAALLALADRVAEMSRLDCVSPGFARELEGELRNLAEVGHG